MKTKLLMVALLTCAYLYSNAQVEKGSTLIGGDVSFASKSDTAKMRGGMVTLKAGRAFSENVVWGVWGAIGHTTTRSRYNSFQTKSDTYGGGVFNRLYKPLGKGFNLYGETSLSYMHMVFTSSDENLKPTRDQVSLGFSPGISYKIFDWAQLELTLPNILSVNYTSTRTVFGGTKLKDKHFNVNTSLSGSTADLLGLGFTLLF
ncbi:autotransporter domain-containing protein [Niabella drilacis]|uniref:Uncharacterized protein n=1 Tax=Niabella drilacis (strain DSM 25811 / CCM 8410 / CCUG 62505 / LMG 26954 / E90) TaxID=1285928 RepID=A0A1G6LT86_NIADE|nr:autotransporter domain-containing protein [Niabella drilacis]SDC46508.1 hypothetical protein SAMN04487894_102455 [Niabella drilacis]